MLSREWISTINKILDSQKVELRLPKKLLICLEMKITLISKKKIIEH